MAVITVSRNVGSHGDKLTVRLAERLNYRLVGRNELVRLAAGFGGPEAIDHSPELRERSPSFWERLNEERRRNASALRNAVIQLAAEGNVIIVGLGAGLLLKNLRNVLRLQIIAPNDIRLARVMADGDGDDVPGPLTRDQARDLIRRRDRDVAGYIRYMFNIDWNDSSQWDLVVNTARVDLDQAVEMIATYIQHPSMQPSAEDQERLADLTLASKVDTTLLNQSAVWINGLRVRAERGVVHLEGEVIVEEDRDTAEEIARAVEGVRGVENDLRIQPPPLTGM